MKKPVQSIASPEALNKRLQKTSPATWAVLFGVIALLIGFFAWSFFATISVKLTGSASVVSNQASLQIKEKDLAKVNVGQKVYILEQVGEVIRSDNRGKCIRDRPPCHYHFPAQDFCGNRVAGTD